MDYHSRWDWRFVTIINVFIFKKKTAYEMRISDWSSDVCSSDLGGGHGWFSAQPCPVSGLCDKGRIDPGLRPSDARTNLRAVVPMSVGDAQRPRNVVPRHQLEILRGRSVVAVLRDEQAAGNVWSELSPQDRKRVGEGKSGTERLVLGGGRYHK